MKRLQRGPWEFPTAIKRTRTVWVWASKPLPTIPQPRGSPPQNCLFCGAEAMKGVEVLLCAVTRTLPASNSLEPCRSQWGFEVHSLGRTTCSCEKGHKHPSPMLQPREHQSGSLPSGAALSRGSSLQMQSQLARGTSLSTPKAGDLAASSNKQADMYISELLSYSLDRMRKVRLRCSQQLAVAAVSLASARAFGSCCSVPHFCQSSQADTFFMCFCAQPD